MAAHALTTTEPRRGTTPRTARVLTSPIPGEILLGSDATGGPVLRLPANIGRADIEAAVAALADLLDRMGAPLADHRPDAEPDPVQPSALPTPFAVTVHAIVPTLDQQRAAYRRNGDRLPANLRGGLARALFG